MVAAADCDDDDGGGSLVYSHSAVRRLRMTAAAAASLLSRSVCIHFVGLCCGVGRRRGWMREERRGKDGREGGRVKLKR